MDTFIGPIKVIRRSPGSGQVQAAYQAYLEKLKLAE